MKKELSWSMLLGRAAVIRMKVDEHYGAYSPNKSMTWTPPGTKDCYR